MGRTSGEVSRNDCRQRTHRPGHHFTLNGIVWTNRQTPGGLSCRRGPASRQILTASTTRQGKMLSVKHFVTQLLLRVTSSSASPALAAESGTTDQAAAKL